MSPLCTQPWWTRQMARPPYVRRGVQVGHQSLERVTFGVGRRRNVLDQQLEKHLQAGGVGDFFGG